MQENDTPVAPAPQVLCLETVYLIACLVPGIAGHYKIGKSYNAEARMFDLQAACPFALELLHEIATNDASWLESMLHRQYDRVRVRGEWFQLGKADVTDIRQTRRLDRVTRLDPAPQEEAELSPAPVLWGRRGRPRTWPPKMLFHKSSGQARVLLRAEGRTVGVYLGKANEEGTRFRYTSLIQYLESQGYVHANDALRTSIIASLPRNLIFS